ncbi:MAG: bifunctional folylpolyglutamate synthase/dihydrofolate synthase [Chitinivibrionales bacterium]|nr:bifunctional folylpolyglutamate synthase/dihydrofolate synthase [Chitinivibrionales bacterium]
MEKSRKTLIDSLFQKNAKGMKFGLERMAKASHALGNPHTSFQSIHVAGTNGKGSICTMLHAMLRHCGYSCGLYTSPHIIDFEERFNVNGTAVLPDEWISVYEDIYEVCESNSLTFFEITTLIAFELFRRKKVQWAVIETGLGGRLDATNIITSSASVIATIAYDHTDLLGTTLVSIAAEKLGIVKPHRPLIMIKPVDGAVETIVRQACSRLNAPLSFVDWDRISAIETDVKGTSFTYKNSRYFCNLRGAYQALNAVCSLSTMETLFQIEPHTLKKPLAQAVVAGRFQSYNISGKEIIFDVAHNPEAIQQTCRLLTSLYATVPRCIITGIMADKEFTVMIGYLSRCADRLILVRPKLQRAADTTKLYAAIEPAYRTQTMIIDSVAQAVAEAFGQWQGVVCVVGSFFTVGEAMENLGITPRSQASQTASLLGDDDSHL